MEGDDKMLAIPEGDGSITGGEDNKSPGMNRESKTSALITKLMRQNLDINSFVLELVSESSLTEAKTEVESISKDLGFRLLRLISGKHEEFFKIVSGALTLEVSFETASEYLNNIVERAKGISEYIEKHLEQYEKLVSESNETLERIRLCAARILVSYSSSRLEFLQADLIQRARYITGSNISGIFEYVNLLCECLLELSQLQVHAKKVDSVITINTGQDLVRDYLPSILDLLYPLLSNTNYNMEASKYLKNVLNICVVSGYTYVAARAFFRPISDRINSMTSVFRTTNSDTGIIILDDLYRECLDYIRIHLSPLLDLLKDNILSEMHDIIITECIFDNIAQPIIDCDSLFTAHSQYPRVFFQNYNATIRFCQEFEHLLLSPGYAAIFRKNNIYIDLNKKWNLGSYLAKVSSSIIDSAVKCFNGDLPRDTIEGFREDVKYLRCPESVTIISSIEQCWNDEVFIHSLSGGFMELSFKLVSFYVDNIKEKEKELLKQIESIELSGEELMSEYEKFTMLQVFLYAQESQLAAEKIRSMFDTEILVKIGIKDEVFKNEFRECSRESVAPLTDISENLIKYLKTRLKSLCSIGLGSDSSRVPSNFMIVRKGFVKTLFRPIRITINGLVDALSENTINTLATEVSTSILEGYTEHTERILNTIRKFEKYKISYFGSSNKPESSYEKSPPVYQSNIKNRVHTDSKDLLDEIKRFNIDMNYVPASKQFLEKVEKWADPSFFNTL